MRKIKIIQIGIPIAIALAGLLSMSLIAYFLKNGSISPWKISPYEIVNITFTLQLIVLPISFIALAIMYLYDKEKFKLFFRPGLRKNNWHLYGLAIAIAFTAGNALLMSSGVMAENGSVNKTFYSLIPLVIIFAATNAWSEEIFSRFVIVAGLAGKLKPDTICRISAIIFGLPHFFGTPSGIFGVIMSGFLGWLLAKSVIETKGLGWALVIHFLQDLVIFGAGAMIIAGQK
jgi:membrane protease YdiL (CAAX protease family)